VVIIAYYYALSFFGGVNNDIMNKRFYIGNMCLDGWFLSHLLFYAYIGYNYANCFIFAMALGMLWEGFEYSFGKVIPILFPNFAAKVDPNLASWCYGRIDDWVMNFAGFIIGAGIRQINA
jgi:hypothetical protein